MSKKHEVLLKDYGYFWNNGILIDKGIPGYIPQRIVGKFSSAMAACEHICPIVKEKEFSLRLIKYSYPEYENMPLSEIEKIVM